MTGNRKSGVVLQPRDRHLLTELGIMRLIDLAQARLVGGFGSYQRTHARLSRLARAGLLHQFFWGTVAGGRKSIYGLSAKGAQLVDAEFKGIQRKQHHLLVGDLFVAHQMHINEVFVTLKYRLLPGPGTRFLRWRAFHKPLSQAVLLTPDGYFEIEAAQGVRAMFLEADLGTETRKVWEQKVKQYLQLAMSGEFQRLSGQQQFRVLVIATSRRRLDNLRATIAKTTDKIFWFSTFELINSSGFWSPIWLRPKGDQMQPLL